MIKRYPLRFSLLICSVLALTIASLTLTATEQPVVRWAIQDEPEFRYHFLEKTKTTNLLYATPETGTFNLHGFLRYYKGVLFASWDNQARDENTAGQHGVFRYSTDEGKTWSKQKRLFPPLADYVPASVAKIPKPFQTSQGFAEVDGKLYAVTCVDRALREKVYRFNEVSRTRIGLLACEVRVDGTVGPVFWLSDESPKPETGYPSIPAGNPSLVAKLNAYFKEPANLPQLLFRPRQWPDSDDEHRMTEPTQPWRLDNRTWVRLYRNQGTVHATTRAEIEASRPRRHYASFSFDDGKTWSAPTRTNFPDTGARANSGQLPDGQFYVINNPLLMSARQGGRQMLAISLSKDGLIFDRMAVIKFGTPSQRYEGKSKGAGGFQYPHSEVVGKHLWVIYSVNKEDVEVTRIPLAELYAIDSASQRPVSH
ncbi:exo-alpha-sialidase [Opitutia bacterium ISCC 51]|nr:exo-alpha-sialidase [Opitutae bacterium ISCC 51]QXD29786.1 exo-alpha-sialidase [Opitutae bacterium ISCC 52]